MDSLSSTSPQLRTLDVYSLRDLVIWILVCYVSQLGHLISILFPQNKLRLNVGSDCMVFLVNIGLPKILFETSGSLGVTIALDEAPLKRTFGHFARVMIDVDLTVQLHDQIISRKRGIFIFASVWNINLCLCSANHVCALVIQSRVADMVIFLIMLYEAHSEMNNEKKEIPKKYEPPQPSV